MLTRTFSLFAMACSGFITGCSRSPTTDPDAATGDTRVTASDHSHPHEVPLARTEINKLREDTANWQAAIEHIQKFRDTIRTETAGGTPAKAHHALDLLDHVLQWLPEIAQQSDIPKDHWQSIGENAQTLRDAFDGIHSQIDDGRSPDYQAVAAEIDAAVSGLSAIASDGPDATTRPQ